jgi:hypothetical protein
LRLYFERTRYRRLRQATPAQQVAHARLPVSGTASRNSTKACPFNRGSRTIAPRHSPLVKSKPTTSSRATQYRTRLFAKRKPRGLRNSTVSLGEKTRTRCPSLVSYSRTLVTASMAPNGRSLETTILPLGAIARSSGLNSGSVMGLHRCDWGKGHYGVIALPVRADS